MSLTLMYITNNPITAQIAQDAGVDRIWVDLEYIGKESRQAGMNTVKSRHSIQDIITLRSVVTSSKLMVRVNPIHSSLRNPSDSKKEIDNVIYAGADVVMLPMFKTADEVNRFVEYIDGRATVQILVETAEAVNCIDEILSVDGIDEIHIGLNDLHIAYHQKFMFELLCDGTVANLCYKFKDKGIKYGFGGIARIGYGLLPAEYIIAEHYHLGSTAAILSRDFCDANKVKDPSIVKDIFVDGIKNIRIREKEVSSFSEEQFAENLKTIKEKVNQIVTLKGRT